MANINAALQASLAQTGAVNLQTTTAGDVAQAQIAAQVTALPYETNIANAEINSINAQAWWGDQTQQNIASTQANASILGSIVNGLFGTVQNAQETQPFKF